MILKGKEYDNEGKLIYEGEYLNGKKYKNDKLIFEGEYLNGKKMDQVKNKMVKAN